MAIRLSILICIGGASLLANAPEEYMACNAALRLPWTRTVNYTSTYLDVANDPLYPFGYGLSYTTFTYSDLQLDTHTLQPGGRLTVSVTVTNNGHRMGEEIVQMYIRDVVGSVTRPLLELKGFRKITLGPGETERILFRITEEDLAFYDIDMKRVSEPGEFRVFAGPHSQELLEARFTLAE